MTGIGIGNTNPQADLHIGTGATAPTVADPKLHVEGNAEVTGILKCDTLENPAVDDHIADTNNPHNVTLAQVGGTTDHTALSNIGTNTHAQIDTHIAATNTGTHGATSAATANRIVIRNSTGGFSAGAVDATALTISSAAVATQTYAANLVYNITFKEAVRAKSTNIVNATGIQTVDGVELAVGDRVLLTHQFFGYANGIYVVASGAWTRASDFGGSNITAAVIPVGFEGTTHAGTFWQLTNATDTVDIGEDDLHFQQVFVTGSTYTEGTGIDISGDTISVDLSEITDFTTAQSDISTLQSDLDTAESNISDLQTDMANAVEQSCCYLLHENSVTAYPAASDTNAARGTALRSANTAAVAGDVILMGAATFDLGATAFIPTAGVRIKGLGWEQTIIYSTMNQSDDSGNAIITLSGDGVVLEDFWLRSEPTSLAYYTIPLGRQGSGSFTNAVLKRLKVTGYSDSVFVWASAGCSLRIEDCYLQSKYDTIAMLNSTAGGDSVTVINTDLISIGPFAGSPSTIANNVVIRGATCTFYNCRFYTRGSVSSTITSAARQLDGAGTSTFIGCSFDVSAAAGTVGDMYWELGTSNVYNCKGSGTGGAVSTYTTSGTVNIYNTLANRTLTATAPITIGGGSSATLAADRTIAINTASGSQAGALSSSDWTTFNNKVSTSRSISTTAPITGGGDLSANRTLAIAAATTSVDGYLTSTDWTTFNNKVSTSRSISTTSPLTGGGDLSANRTLAIDTASNSQAGAISSTKHTEFSTRIISMIVYDPTVDVATGTSLASVYIPAAVAGKDLIACHARVITAGTTGNTTIMITRTRSGSSVDMLSTAMDINTGETGSDTGTAGTINTSNDDIAEHDLIAVDVDAVSTTKPKGLIVTLTFR